MARALKGMKYGGRQCKSITGKPAITTSLRMPKEFLEFIASRVSSGDARNATEYLLGLVREAASKLGVHL